VRDKTIAGGLLEGYRSILPHGVYPVAFLFVDIPLEEIDVNVHPAKTEIRFRRTEAVKDVIAEAVRGALASAGIVAEMSTRETEYVLHVETPAAVVPVEPIAQTTIEFPVVEELDLEIAQKVFTEPVTFGRERVDEAVADVEEISLTEQFELIASERSDTTPERFPNVPVPVSDTPQNGATSGALPPLNSAAQLTRSVELEEIRSAAIRPIGQLHESFIIATDDRASCLLISMSRMSGSCSINFAKVRPNDRSNLRICSFLKLSIFRPHRCRRLRLSKATFPRSDFR
jgi:DNA mismatch repair protein MutL